MDQVKKTKGNLPPGPGPGRPKGMPNKATTAFRETVQALLERNSENVAIWLDQVATGSHGKEPAPEKALDLLAKLAEYAAPKLSRTEIAGDQDKPLQTVIKWAQE
jgi:hypothetical protein